MLFGESPWCHFLEIMVIINHQKIRALDAINQPWMPQAPRVLDHGNLFPLLYLPQKFSDGFFQVFSGRCLWWRQWGRGDEMNAVGAHLGRPPAWSSRFLLAGQAWHQPHWDAPCRVRQLVFELVRTHEWKTSEKPLVGSQQITSLRGFLGKSCWWIDVCKNATSDQLPVFDSIWVFGTLQAPVNTTYPLMSRTDLQKETSKFG